MRDVAEGVTPDSHDTFYLGTTRISPRAAQALPRWVMGAVLLAGFAPGWARAVMGQEPSSFWQSIQYSRANCQQRSLAETPTCSASYSPSSANWALELSPPVLRVSE